MFTDDEARLAQMIADLARIRKLLHNSDMQVEHVDKRLEKSESSKEPDDQGGAGRKSSGRPLADHSDQP